MKQRLKTIADVTAVGFGALSWPMLNLIAKRRTSLPRFQRFADRAGFQIRSTHYYEPTYSEAHLPACTTVERSLPGVDLNAEGQLRLLAQFQFADELRAIPVDKPAPAEFGYRNNMYSFGDAEIYYSMIRVKKPRRIIEVGSGQSTLLARLAIDAIRRDDPAYDCQLTCVEPYEAPWLESTGARVIRSRLEDVELTLFDELGANDILFIDSSHVIRPYGDVLRAFQQVMPRLASGVVVHVDDVFTPREYPEHWLRGERRLWNEQYLLEAFLAFNPRFEVICATNWLKHNHWEEFLRACPMMALDPDQEPGAFWFAAK